MRFRRLSCASTGGARLDEQLSSFVVTYDLRPRVRHWIAIASVFTALGAIGMTSLLSEVTPMAVVSVLSWLALNLVVLWNDARRRVSLLTVVLAGATLVALAQTASPFNIMIYTVMVMTVVAAVPLLHSALIVAVVGIGNATLAEPVPPENVREMVPFLISFPMVFIYFVGLAVRQTVAERLKVERLATTVSQQNERLRVSNEQLDRMAAREERMRIARDLHDRLGHGLMTIKVYLHVLETRPLQDEQGTSAAARALEATERATRELRRCVGLLRESPTEPTLSVAIRKLVAALPTPPEVVVRISGTPRRVDPVKEVIIFRVLQEALTNVAKHANAGKATVELTYRPETLALSVSDDGVGANEVSHGHGLRGLSERLERAGGELAIETHLGHGFNLTARVPVTSARRGEFVESSWRRLGPVAPQYSSGREISRD